MNRVFDEHDRAQQMKLSSLIDEVAAYDKLTFNVTTLAEWRTKWLQGFANYLYQTKDGDGNLIDPDGEVLAFWNGRKMSNGSGPNLFIDTHIRDHNGVTIYVIPSTVTSIGTKLTDVAVEPALYTLIANALSNPLPHYREMEVNMAIIAKFNGRKEDYTDAYRKTLLMNHMFIKEGYPPLVEVPESITPKTEATETTPTVDTPDDGGIAIDDGFVF